MKQFIAFTIAAAAAQAAEVPTWSKDVAPIVYRSCVGCHRPGDIAPMSFMSYKEARPWAKAIRAAAVTRTMPPWHADPKIGHFANDPRLAENEIAALRAWADGGAPEGDAKQAPAPPKFTEGWKLGKPDMVFDIGEDYVVEGAGQDINTNFTIEMKLDHDIWVTGVDLQPGNRRVVHHAHVKVIEPVTKTKKKLEPDPVFNMAKLTVREGTESWLRVDAPVLDDGCSHPGGGDAPGADREAEAVLASFLPGREPDSWPAGYAKRIPAGSKLQFAVHYSRTTGKREVDRTRVGFILAKEPPKFEVKRRDIHNTFFAIPAGAENHEVTACFTIPEDTMLMSYTPHMHYRGKAQRVEVTRPGSSEPETILNIPKYDFEWQTLYKFVKAVPLPKGTRLRIVAHFDNSPNNRANPDPARIVRWGTPTKAEMMDGWLEYITPGSAVGEAGGLETATPRR